MKLCELFRQVTLGDDPLYGADATSDQAEAQANSQPPKWFVFWWPRRRTGQGMLLTCSQVQSTLHEERSSPYRYAARSSRGGTAATTCTMGSTMTVDEALTSSCAMREPPTLPHARS